MFPSVSFVERMISLFSKLRPLGFKQWFFSFVFHFFLYASRLRSIFCQLRLNVYVASGVDKNMGNGIKVLFFGNERFPLFISDLLFVDKPDVKMFGKEWIWHVGRDKTVKESDSDMVLVSCDCFYNRFLHKADLFVFPHMIDMILDIRKPSEEFFKNLSNSAKADIRKVKQHDYSFEVTSDINQLRMFYNDMYLPLIKNRFGDKPLFIPPFVFFRVLHEIGYKFLLAKKDDAYISGNIFHCDNKEMYTKYFGILNGDFDLIKKGASAAIYYFSIVWAKENKLSNVNFGACRPFLNDGVFQYKKKWGTIIEPYSLVPEIFGLKILNNSEPMKQFLIDNPFIGLNEKNEITGFVFVDKDEISDKEKELYEKRFNVSGIHELRFFSL
ncbi:MAG: hypothetical protein KAS04_05170 [Candidatus Aenigmarchaeota archaeon]|nr:hypothetical protein [Candidatus Aenigmarchaeota archaeon]